MKVSNIMFHGNSFSDSRVDMCVQAEKGTDRLTDMTQLIDAFRGYAKAPKIIKQ
jgi:murein L,D-transpeptidase YafK